MTALTDARAHLSKSREFLQAAEINRDLDLYNAATSAAVISAINSKDVICLALLGRTRKAENHNEAVFELKAAGAAGAVLAPTLGRLLKLKTKSQYQSIAISAPDAAKAVEWAKRMLAAAEDAYSNR